MLDTGQKVHFVRLKKHVPAPWDWAAHQLFGLDQNVAIADPYVEESNEEITPDISRDSFHPEQLPEASFDMEPTGPVPPHRPRFRHVLSLLWNEESDVDNSVTLDIRLSQNLTENQWILLLKKHSNQFS